MRGYTGFPQILRAMTPILKEEQIDIEGIRVWLKRHPFKTPPNIQVRIEGIAIIWAHGRADALVKARQHIAQNLAHSKSR